MRAFIAAEIPSSHTDYDISEIKRFTRTSIVKPENRHITLFFLGDISEEDAKVTEYCMKALPANGFHVAMTGIETFKMGAVYIKCESDPLSEYRENLRELLRGEKVPFDDKEFRMHMTLCRIRDVKDKSGLNNFIKSHQATFQTNHFNVESIVLYKSSLTQSGPIYSPLFEMK